MSGIVRTAGEQLQQSLEPVLTGEEKNRLIVKLGSVLLAGSLLVTGKLYEAYFPDQDVVYGLILLIGALIASFSIFRVALQGFFSREPKAMMEQLVSLALLAALARGDYTTAILIPLLMAISHFLEERSILGARAAIEGLKTLQAREAILLTSEGEQIVATEALQPGDRILIRPGDMFPVDGNVIKGRSSVDQSSMTGESIPIDVSEGDQIFAGTVNIQGLLEVSVTKEVAKTSLSKIVELLKKAEESKTSTMRLIERYAIYYLPLVILIAAAVLFMTQDLYRVIAVLVVSCPCAQILVSSTAMVAALAVSSRNGILIKSSGFLEALGDIKTIIFDKTGTLTKGDLNVTQMKPLNGTSDAELIRAAAVAARGSSHPVSLAIVRAAVNLAVEEVAVVEEAAGLGVTANVDNSQIVLGKRDWLESLGVEVPDDTDYPGSTVWIAKEKKLLGYLLLADTLRPEAEVMIQSIRELEVERIILLTGDRRQVAQTIKESLDLDEVFAECLPSDKLDVVEKERDEDTRIMVVGDGVNDALALARADVGVAMGAMGSDIAVQSADIALMGDDLRKLPFLIRLSRKTRNVIYQNMVIAALSSAIMITLAAIGLISPLAGAFLHNIGALLVLLNSARLLRFDVS